VTAEAGETIWQVADRLGNEIPHLCWQPYPGYRADGNLPGLHGGDQGERVLAASCIRKPAAGMEVTTNNERAKTARKMVIEMLVADQPKKEEARDPQSEFWRWADAMNVQASRFPSRGKAGTNGVPTPDLSHRPWP
jgi:formate dehydrogenase major subunit